MGNSDQMVLVIAALVAIGIGFIMLGRWWWRDWKHARRRKRASRGEKQARGFLRRQGFAILEEQATRTWTMLINGEETEVTARADFLVEKAGLRYVAEVKTGSTVVRATYPGTRRQLLEYWFVFDVDGLLLVNIARREIDEIAFPMD